MIAASRIADVERLLADGMNIPRIVRETGVPKPVVLRMHRGETPEPEKRDRFVRVRGRARQLAKPTKEPDRDYCPMLVSISYPKFRGSILEDDLIRRLGLKPRDENPAAWAKESEL